MRKLKDTNNNKSGFSEMYNANKILAIFDMAFKLMIINALTIVFSLGIITFIPSLVASYRTIKGTYEENKGNVFREFYNNFIYSFKDTVWVSVIAIILLALFSFSNRWYMTMVSELTKDGNSQGWLTFYIAAYMGFLIVGAFILLVFIQIPMVVTHFRFRLKDKFKFAFYMAFRHINISLLELVFVIAVLSTWFYLTVVVFVWGLSLPMFLIYLVSRRYYWAAVKSSNAGYEEDEFDRQGVVQNREVYEDEEEKRLDKERLEKLNQITKEDKK